MNKEEFDIFARKVRPKLLALIHNYAINTGVEAEDIVQEALLTLWELTEKDYPIRDAEALAVRITKSTCVAHYRKARPDIQHLMHDNYTGGIEATMLTDYEDLRKIKQLLFRSLTATQRKYLHLRNDEGLSLDEIAQATGKPKTSIKSTISAARKQMLDMIKKQL